MTDVSELIGRLTRKAYRSEIWHEPYGVMDAPCEADDAGAEEYNVNPDGPEAASALQSLSERVAGLQWHDGAPPHPWDKEWFIAITTYGDRVALTALPEEYTYDFKTADDTHIRRDKIAKWMQFPDSEFIAPEHLQSLSERNAVLEEALNAIIDRAPERDAKWSGMNAHDIARKALTKEGIENG